MSTVPSFHDTFLPRRFSRSTTASAGGGAAVAGGGAEEDEEGEGSTVTVTDLADDECGGGGARAAMGIGDFPPLQVECLCVATGKKISVNRCKSGSNNNIHHMSLFQKVLR